MTLYNSGLRAVTPLEPVSAGRGRLSRRGASVVAAVGVGLFALTAPITAFAATSTTGIPVKSLGDLTGSCCNPTALAINHAGTAAAGLSTSNGHAIRWQDLGDKLPKVVDLGTGLAGALDAVASGINNDWTAVGWSDIDQGQGPVEFPVRWDARGKLFALPLPPGDVGGNANAINDKGVAGGAALVNVCCSKPQAVTWAKDGTPTVLAQSGKVTSINDNGLAAGVDYGPHHAVVWDTATGVETDLGTLPGDNYSEAYGINRQGQVVGFSANSSTGTLQAVTWDAATHAITALPLAPDGCNYAGYAFGINDTGQIVGFDGCSDEPLFWNPGASAPVNLGSLPSDTGGRANSIDNRHHAVGQSDGPNGSTAVMWSVGRP